MASQTNDSINPDCCCLLPGEEARIELSADALSWVLAQSWAMRLIPSLFAVVLLGAACSAGDQSSLSETDEPSTSASTSATSAETTSAETTTAETTTALPPPTDDDVVSVDGSIGTALDLALGWLNGEPLDEVSYQGVFDDAFRRQVPYDEFVAISGQLTEAGPWMIEAIDASSDTEVEAAIVNESGEEWQLLVGIEDPDQVVLTTLFVGPRLQIPEVVSIPDALASLEEQGTVRFLAADVSDGTCMPVSEQHSHEQMPLGSIFKLSVLGAVVSAISDGVVGWDSPVVLDDRLDSFPSGTTQHDPAGSELTVRELAERMISISDNTATDHLIDLVGREAVEEAVVASGHDDPDLNVPFLTTRELFLLKLSATDEERAQYLEGSVAEKRTFLSELSDWPLPDLDAMASFDTPVEVESLEWFGSPVDVCRTLVSLVDDEEARRILAINPGVPAPDGLWDYLGFKGGSEPGVLAVAWYGTTSDGSSYVVVGGVVNADRLIDDQTAAELLAGARDLVAKAS